MIKDLKDLTINSFIGMLPSVINYNNQSIKDSFDYIFDDTKNCYKHDLINPTGKVEAAWGKFINITTDTLQIKDASTLFNSTFKNISHNMWADRFGDSSVKPNNSYCHNIEAIQGLSEKFSSIDASLYEVYLLYKKLTVTDSSRNVWNKSGSWELAIPNIPSTSTSTSTSTTDASHASYNQEIADTSSMDINPNIPHFYGASKNAGYSDYDMDYINILKEGNTTEYSYPKSLFTEAPSKIKREILFPGDYKDIITGKVYHYVDMTNSEYAVITNEHDYAFNTTNLGQVIQILFKPVNDNDFRIKLTSNSDKHAYVKASDADMTELSLICYNIDKQLGAQWRIYGKNSFGNIEIK